MRPRATTALLLFLSSGLAAPLVAAPSKREQAQKALKTLATSRETDERASAAETLGSLGAVDGVPALALALTDRDVEVRAAAAYSLWELRASAEPVKPLLLEALDRETDGRTILNEVATLEALGVPKQELAEAFERALEDRDEEVRIDAADAAVGALPPLRLLRIAIDGIAIDADHFTDAAQLLSKLVETGDRKLIPPLLEAARRGDPRQVQEATTHLGIFEPRPPELLPLAQRQLDSRYPDVRRNAAGTLSRYMADAKPALPRLIALLADPSDDVRAAAAQCIDSILRGHPADPAAVTALITAFETTRTPHARETIASTLGTMGPAAKAAVPVLSKELQSSDASLRNQVQRTLSEIDPKH